MMDFLLNCKLMKRRTRLQYLKIMHYMKRFVSNLKIQTIKIMPRYLLPCSNKGQDTENGNSTPGLINYNKITTLGPGWFN